MMRLVDCKKMINYYHLPMPNTLKDIKHKAINLLVNKMCKCYCDKKVQYIIYRKYYNSRNNKNLNYTRKF
jgi:hypothetical protein